MGQKTSQAIPFLLNLGEFSLCVSDTPGLIGVMSLSGDFF